MNTARRLGEEIETAVRLFILYVDGYNHVKVGDKTHTVDTNAPTKTQQQVTVNKPMEHKCNLKRQRNRERGDDTAETTGKQRNERFKPKQ